MTKREVLEAAARGEGCLGKCHDDEPVFVVCGRDKVGPTTVRIWEALAKLLGTPTRKRSGAIADAVAMEAWQKAHGAKVPD
jgi:hypothetical protein